jgi:membrane protease YdiL (CAAX protease family)
MGKIRNALGNTRPVVNTRQLIATLAPPLLVLTMIPVFRLYVNVFEWHWRIGWYLGLVTYWITWCGLFSWLLIGKKSIIQLIRPQPLSLNVLILMLVPIIGAALYRLVPGMSYEKPALWIFLLLLSTNFGNGFFEELLWRGVYLDLFPESAWLGMVWPSLWFGVWHYAPGAISPEGNPLGLMIGSGFMGIYLSFLARRTGTIWWTIWAHAIGGFVMIL